MKILATYFWRPIHKVVNYLALKFQPAGLTEDPGPFLWRLNDAISARYCEPFVPTQEQTNELAALLGDALGLTPVYGENGAFLGYKEEMEADTTEIPIIDVTDEAKLIEDTKP